MMRGQQAWIRLRGTPDDPESFDLATWNGLRWEIPRRNSLGDMIYIQIPDYMVAETMPPSADPQKIYRDLPTNAEGKK
ncbi:MAG: hypothetical protein HY231_24420 [Acidobacteria bacterium]|nr:hypothetical protein [Acidobacteriota bacterium]